MQEEQRKQEIIKKTKKLRNNYPIKGVPLFEVESLVQREGIDYDSLQKEDL